MNNRNFIILQLLLLSTFISNYISSGNPGFLIVCLGIVGLLIATFEIINFNRILYYVSLLCILIFQSILLINAYLFKMTYLQDGKQYMACALAVIACIIIIAMILKPNNFKD